MQYERISIRKSLADNVLALILTIARQNEALITKEQQTGMNLLGDIVRVALPPQPLIVKEEKELVLDKNLVIERREMKERKRIVLSEMS